MRSSCRWFPQVRSLAKYGILLLFLLLGTYIYTVASNYATYVNNSTRIYRKGGAGNGTENISLIDTWNDVVGTLERERAPMFYFLIDNLPWLWTGTFFVSQVVVVIRRKENFLVQALIAETLLMVFNGVLHCATILPDSNSGTRACHDPAKAIAGPWIYHPMVTFDYCGDMMWSGHTSHTFLSMILTYWTVRTFSLCKSRAFARGYWVSCIMMILFEINFLVVFRFHYSIDVLVALAMTGLIVTHGAFHYVVDLYVGLFTPADPVGATDLGRLVEGDSDDSEAGIGDHDRQWGPLRGDRDRDLDSERSLETV